MSRRKELKGVAYGFLSSFVSRNNDINGYWGLGKLYQFAVENGTDEIEMNLSKNDCIPSNTIPKAIIAQYSQALSIMFEKQGLPKFWLSKAIVRIKFAQSDDADSSVRGYLGDPFQCSVILQDDLGKDRLASTFGRCRVHNPDREYQSNRVSKG